MTGPEMSRTELEAIAQAGKNAEAALLAIGAGPGPEFAAACRLILSGDTPDLVNAVLRMTPIREDVERIAIDIIAGRRAIRLPLNPPAGTLEPGPFMMATLKLVAELGLNADDTRAAVAGRRMVIGMAQVGALMASKRDADARSRRA